MNFLFWKKKPVAEKEGESVTGETVAADETSPKTAKPGWFARLKSALKLSRKKGDSDNMNEIAPPAEHTGGDHEVHKTSRPGKITDTEGDESKQVKAGFLVRLKNALHLSRKKAEPDEGGLPERSAKHINKKTPGSPHKKTGTRAGGKSGGLEEEEEQPTRKHGKKKWIILALLILLGGGFGAWKWLQPPPDHKAPPATAQEQEKLEGTLAEKPPDAAALTEAAEKAQAEATVLAEAAAKAQAEATAQAEAAAQAKAETEAAAQAKAAADQAVTESPTAATPPASADTDVQAQLDALRKQNQEMQTQLEALKNQRPSATRPAGAATSPPKGGVLIINGKHTKESAQGLKQVIEEMNAASGQKPSK